MKRTTTQNYLYLHFEGYFQCRLATDPDPTREPRGVSGYTYALAGEDDLDQVIFLQGEQIDPRNYRESFPAYPGPQEDMGVKVTHVTYQDQKTNYPPGELLKGAKVFLLDDPVYEMRNQIVSDGVQRIAPIINPFKIRVEQASEGIVLERFDPLAEDKSDTPSWQLDFASYQRRVPAYNRPSDEVLEAISSEGELDVRAYFQEKKEWLLTKIALEQAKANPDVIKLSNWQTRLGAIDEYSGDPNSSTPGFIENRMALQSVWQHSIRGTNPVIEGLDRLHGRASRGDWQTRFWMGGWDGDVMRGYMKGWLGVPFQVLD